MNIKGMNFPFSFFRISGCSALRRLYLDNLVDIIALFYSLITLHSYPSISIFIMIILDSIVSNTSSTLMDLTGGCRTKNQALLTEKMTHNSTYIGSCHILLLQLLQSQHLSTTRVRGVGYPGVVRHVIITGSRNRINLFNDGESL